MTNRPGRRIRLRFARRVVLLTAAAALAAFAIALPILASRPGNPPDAGLLAAMLGLLLIAALLGLPARRLQLVVDAVEIRYTPGYGLTRRVPRAGVRFAEVYSVGPGDMTQQRYLDLHGATADGRERCLLSIPIGVFAPADQAWLIDFAATLNPGPLGAR